MKLTVKLLSVLALVLAVGGDAFAQDYVKGEVVKVDEKQKKVTIKHEPLTNLDMPAMTMVFVVADDAMIEKVKAGQPIEFTADRVNGRITVTGIK
jgi:Cu/Ag efflux protein CusF